MLDIGSQVRQEASRAFKKFPSICWVRLVWYSKIFRTSARFLFWAAWGCWLCLPSLVLIDGAGIAGDATFWGACWTRCVGCYMWVLFRCWILIQGGNWSASAVHGLAMMVTCLARSAGDTWWWMRSRCCWYVSVMQESVQVHSLMCDVLHVSLHAVNSGRVIQVRFIKEGMASCDWWHLKKLSKRFVVLLWRWEASMSVDGILVIADWLVHECEVSWKSWWLGGYDDQVRGSSKSVFCWDV